MDLYLDNREFFVISLTLFALLTNYYIYMKQQKDYEEALSFAYFSAGKLELCQTLKKKNKNKLFGICVGSLIVSLKQQSGLSWLNSYWKIEQSPRGYAVPCLPKEEDFNLICRRQEDINKVLEMLRQKGIDADLLDEKAVYWLRDNFSHSLAFAFMMKERLATLRDKFDDKACLSRFVWYL